MVSRWPTRVKLSLRAKRGLLVGGGDAVQRTGLPRCVAPPDDQLGTRERPPGFTLRKPQEYNRRRDYEFRNTDGGNVRLPRGATVAVLQMRVFPDPILRQRARKVTQFDAKLAKLAADMEETMNAHHGVGLAANQVGVLQRMCVVKMEDWEEALVLVNPEIMRREGLREVEEGCLSLPGYRGMVNRAERIRVRYQDLTGKQQRLKAECMLAQAVEHETDHLNGILYIDHLIAHDQFFRIHVDEDGDVEYLPTGEPDAAELEAAARRMNSRNVVPQFDPSNGRPATRETDDVTVAD